MNAAVEWWAPMMASGHLARTPRAVDPFGLDDYGKVGVGMSMAMTYPAALMVPGSTIENARMRASVVLSSDVLYPSDKGLLLRYWVRRPDGIATYWCCPPPPVARGEIAMADASVISAVWTDFLVDGYVDTPENGIGMPVSTTWYGARGRDARVESR